MNRTFIFCLVFVALNVVGSGCGDPQVTVPEPLQIAHMPLSGAVDVALDVQPAIFFTDAVSEASLSGAIQLQSTSLTVTADGSECAQDWTDVEIEASLKEGEPAVVLVNRPASSGDLDGGTCYRLTCTTLVRGVSTGPLEDLGIPDRPGIGAESIFRTRSD